MEAGGVLVRDDSGKVVDRTRSARPSWWQDTGITMPRTQMVLGKVVKGEELTDTQQRDYDTLIKAIGDNEPSLLEMIKEKRIYDNKRASLEKAGASEEEIFELISLAKEDESAGITTEITADDVDQSDVATLDLINSLSAPNIPGTPASTTKQQPSEGDTKRGLSKSVKEQAIEEGLKADFGDLPSYEKRNMADVAKRVSDFIENDYEKAKRIALGEEAEVGDIRSQELFTGLRIKALAEGDVDTLRELGTSEKASAIATELGQRVKALDSSDVKDPVAIIKDVTNTRIAAAEKRIGKDGVKAEKKKAKSEIKDEIKAVVKKMDWQGFIDSLEC
jgi:hypothetical protein